MPLAVAFAAIFVGWHLPGPYERTFVSDATFWAMHASLLAAAVPFWAAVLRATRSRRSSPDALPAIAFVAMAMGLLGAVLTFAPAALYAPHAATTAAYGRSALEDQQLGGLVMWVPGSATLLVAAIAVAVQLARRGAEAVVPSSSSPST
jgi:putative membrane protein